MVPAEIGRRIPEAFAQSKTDSGRRCATGVSVEVARFA
jgi:hypothetical protein